MKRFNTTGTCYPDQHYMVDVTQRLQVIRQMIGRGDYFCITRGRQYGKTTTLNALVERYSDEYSFFFISFEGLGDAAFRTEEKQLAEYLEYFHLDKGYLVSFCFNQSKQAGVTDRLIEGKQIIEAIV